MTGTSDQRITRGYTTAVITPWGRETYQVWLNETDGGWLARIVTIPSRMWALPGGQEAVKFTGETAKQAEAAAIHFIEEECIRTRRRMVPPLASTGSDVVEAAPSALAKSPVRKHSPVRPLTQSSFPLAVQSPLSSESSSASPSRPAPRLPHRLLVKFGTRNPDRPGVTANLSETGMFIITDQPAPVGAQVLIDLRLPTGPVVLGGEVVWARNRKEAGRSLGFGVRLTERPREYVKQLRDGP